MPKSFAAALLFLSIAHTDPAMCQTVDMKELPQETLLSMPEPPLEYNVSKHPLIKDGKVQGFAVAVVKEGSMSRAVITVELRDLSTKGARVAAYKGYVNGVASGLIERGYKITQSKLPELEKIDFKSPVVVDLILANGDGANLFVRKRVFFTSRGYDITVISSSKEDLNLLCEWTAQIRPAASDVLRSKDAGDNSGPRP